MHHLRTPDGVRLAVHDLAGARHRPIVALAHATGFHGLVFGPMADVLGETHRVVSWDFRGHGASDPGTGRPLDWHDFCIDVRTVVDGERLTGTVGFGHSMGGAALVMAEQARPGTFAGLCLYEPIIMAPVVFDESAPLVNSARRRREVFPGRAEALANFASKPPMASFHPDALRAYVDHGLVDQPDGTVRLACRSDFEASIYETGGHHDTFSHLARVRCPVMVMVGGDDGPAAAFAPLVAAEISGAELVRYDDLGHFGPLEQPERVARDLANWIANLP